MQPVKKTKDGFEKKGRSLKKLEQSLGKVQFRVALPTAENTNGSARFWHLANNDSRALGKCLDIKEDRQKKSTNWRSLAKELRNEIEQQKRLQVYNTPFSFLSTVGGKNTNICSVPENNNSKNKPAPTRPKTAKLFATGNFSTPNTAIIEDESGIDDFYRRVETQLRTKDQTRNQQINENDCPSEEGSSMMREQKHWHGVRPMTGTLSASRLNRNELQSAKERANVAKIKQIQSTNYLSPVERIGLNMQNIATFKYVHLQTLKQGQAYNKPYVPLHYSIKGLSSLTPNTIDPHCGPPIMVSLFPEFFDCNPVKSQETRVLYITGLLCQMRGTFDPDFVLRCYKSQQLTVEQQQLYRKELDNIRTELISPYRSLWVENAVRAFSNSDINEDTLLRCVKQIWHFYEDSMRRCILEYNLLNPETRIKLGLNRPAYKYKNTMEILTPRCTYSRSIFTSWSQYVGDARSFLSNNLVKYGSTSLAVSDWFTGFSDTRLFQFSLPSMLSRQGYCVDIDHFIEFEETHFANRRQLLTHIWFRGILSIVFHGKYLYECRNNPWPTIVKSDGIDKRDEYHLSTKNFYKNRPPYIILQELYVNYFAIKVPELSKPIEELADIQGHQQHMQLVAHPSFAKVLRSIEQLLSTQIYTLIDINLSYMEKFIDDGLKDDCPLLKMNLTIRNDMLVFNKTRQEMLSQFEKLIGLLLGMDFKGSRIHPKENAKETSRYMKYLPGLTIRNVLQKTHIKVSWTNTDVFKNRIANLINKIGFGYEECSVILKKFEVFQPLVRRPDLTFEFLSVDFDQEGYQYEDFLKHTDNLRNYQEQLNNLDDSYNYTLFKVSVAPVKTFLGQKISEMLYLAQKKYKRILFRDIHLVEGTANQLSQKLLSCNKTAGELSEAQLLLDNVLSTTLPNLRQSCAKTIKVMLSYIGTMDVSNASSSVLSVVQSKLTYLYKLPQGIKRLIEGIVEQKHAKERSFLELDLRESIQSVQKRLASFKDDIYQGIMNFTYTHSKLQNYIEQLTEFQNKANQLQKNLQVLEKDHCLLFREDSDQILSMQKTFEKEMRVGRVFCTFWQILHRFYQYTRSAGKAEVRHLDVQFFQKTVRQCRARSQEVGPLLPPKSVYLKYLNQFHSQLVPYENSIRLLKQLSTSTLTNTHYQKLPEPKWPYLPVKQVIELWNQKQEREREQDQLLINRVCEAAQLEYQVRTILTSSRQKISNMRLKATVKNNMEVIEWREEKKEIDSTSFELGNAKQKLSNSLRNADSLFNVQAMQLREEISKTLLVIDKVYVICNKVEYIQKEFAAIRGLFSIEDMGHINENVEKFRLVQEIWNQLLRVITCCNSLNEVVEKNTLLIHLNKGEQLLEDIRCSLEASQSKLCQAFPRLFLVQKELLFNTICSYDQAGTKQTILSCYPTLGQVDIENGCVVAVGKQFRLRLNTVVQVESRYTQIQRWMEDLECQIRRTLKSLYSSDDAVPTQILILRQWVRFTQQVEDYYAGNKQQQFEEQNCTCETLQISRMLQRYIWDGVTTNSIRIEEWKQYPRFYLKNSVVTVRMCDSMHEYSFQYMDNIQLKLANWQQYSHSYIGTSSVGKSTYLFNISQLVGRQLRSIDADCKPQTVEGIMKACIDTDIWLLIRHPSLLDERCLRIIYQHIKIHQINPRNRGFEYFATLSKIEYESNTKNLIIKELIRNSVQFWTPDYQKLVLDYASIFSIGSVGLVLSRLVSSLIFAGCIINTSTLQLIKSRLESYSCRDQASISEDIQRTMIEVFGNTQHKQLIRSFFMKDTQNCRGQQRQSINVGRSSRPKIYYGQDCISHKTTKIKQRYANNGIKYIYGASVNPSTLRQLINQTPSTTIIHIDRGLNLMQHISQIVSETGHIHIYEQGSICSHDPFSLLSGDLVYLAPNPEDYELPVAIMAYHNLIESLEYRLNLHNTFYQTRMQFIHIFSSLIAQVKQQTALRVQPFVLYALIWSYGHTNNTHTDQIFKEELSKCKDLMSYLPKENSLDQVILNNGKLALSKPGKFKLLFKPQVQASSWLLPHLTYLSTHTNCNIWLGTSRYLTGHLRQISGLYLGCSQYSTRQSIFAQMESLMLDRTANARHYTTKFADKIRVIVDDVHMLPNNSVHMLTQLLVSQTIQQFMDSSVINSEYVFGSKRQDSVQLSRIRSRCIQIHISDKDCQSVQQSIYRAVFRDSSDRLTDSLFNLQMKFKEEYHNVQMSEYQLVSPLYAMNMTELLPVVDRVTAISLIPRLPLSISTNDSAISLEQIHRVLTQDKHKFYKYLDTIVLTNELLLQVQILCRHLKERHNVMVVGPRHSGKTTALRLAALVLNYQIGEGPLSQGNSDNHEIRYMKQSEVEPQLLEYFIKNRKMSPCHDIVNRVKHNSDTPMIVLNVEDAAEYRSWQPYFQLVNFQTPSNAALEHIWSCCLPPSLKSNQQLLTVLHDLGLSESIITASTFYKLFNKLWDRNSRKLEQLKKECEICQTKLETISPDRVELHEKSIRMLSSQIDRLEEECRKIKVNTTSLSKLEEQYQSRCSSLQEQRDQLEKQISNLTSVRTSSINIIEVKLQRMQVKMTQTDIKTISKPFIDILSKIIGKPLESISQMKSIVKSGLSTETISMVDEFILEKLQTKLTPSNKSVVQLLQHLSQWNKMKLRSPEAQNKASVLALQKDQLQKQINSMSISVQEVSAALLNSRNQEQAVYEKISTKNNEKHNLTEITNRSRELYRQFSRLDPISKLNQQAVKLSEFNGDVLLTSLILMGFPQEELRHQLANINISSDYSLALHFHEADKLRRVKAKYSVSDSELQRLTEAYYSPKTTCITLRKESVPEFIEMVRYMFEDECDLLHIPIDMKEGHDGAIRLIKDKLHSEQAFLDLTIIIEKCTMLEDPRLSRLIKTDRCLLLDQRQLIGLTLDTVVPTRRNYRLLFIRADVGVPPTAQPYTKIMKLGECQSEVADQMYDTLTCIRQANMYSTKLIVEQSYYEQLNTADSNHSSLLRYIKSPALSLAEYEDVYMTIFGLSETLYQLYNSLSINSQKLQSQQKQIKSKYGGLVDKCVQLHRLYLLIQNWQLEFKPYSWQTIFSETVDKLKKKSGQEFEQCLPLVLAESIFQYVHKQTHQSTQILYLLGLYLLESGVNIRQIKKLTNCHYTYSAQERFQSSTKMYSKFVTMKTQLGPADFIQACRKELPARYTSMLDPHIRNDTWYVKTIEQQLEFKTKMFAFMVPFATLSEVIRQIQQKHKKVFEYYTPYEGQSEEQVERVIRDTWKKGHWLMVFNIHQQPQTLTTIHQCLTHKKLEHQNDFRVWVTLEPSHISSLPDYCFQLMEIDKPPSKPAAQLEVVSQQTVETTEGFLRLSLEKNPAKVVQDWLVKYSIRNKIHLNSLAIKMLPYDPKTVLIASQSQLPVELPTRLQSGYGGALFVIELFVESNRQKTAEPNWYELLRKLIN